MLSSYIKYLVTLDSFFYGTHVNLHFDPIRVLIPMGYTQPMTRMYQNPYPCVRVRVLTGTGTGCPEKPQGSPCHSLASAVDRVTSSCLRELQETAPPSMRYAWPEIACLCSCDAPSASVNPSNPSFPPPKVNPQSFVPER